MRADGVSRQWNKSFTMKVVSSPKLNRQTCCFVVFQIGDVCAVLADQEQALPGGQQHQASGHTGTISKIQSLIQFENRFSEHHEALLGPAECAGSQA